MTNPSGVDFKILLGSLFLLYSDSYWKQKTFIVICVLYKTNDKMGEIVSVIQKGPCNVPKRLVYYEQSFVKIMFCDHI